MTLPVPVITGPRYKVTMIFDYGKFGFSQTYYYVSQSTSPLGLRADIRGATYQLLNYAILAKMTSDVSLRAVRYSEDKPNGASGLFSPGDVLQENGALGTIPGMQTDGALFRLFDSTLQYKRTVEYRGLPHTYNLSTPSQPEFIPGANLKSFLDRLTLLLTSPNALAIGAEPRAGLNGQWVMRIRDRNETSSPITRAKGLRLDSDGIHWNVLVDTNPGYTTSQEIVIRGFRAKCLRKLNGPAIHLGTIVAQAPDTGFLVRTTLKNCCVGISEVKAKGTVRPLGFISTPFGPINQFWRFTSRKTGRPSKRSVGKSSSQCC